MSSNFLWEVTPEMVYSLPDKLRAAQGIFTATRGLHTAAIFDAQGQLLNLWEDVGRHNALDKLIGTALLSDQLPLNNCIALVSGRSSFEILQKSTTAGVPSSLTVSVAKEFGIILIAFLRGEQFSIYTGLQRINAA